MKTVGKQKETNKEQETNKEETKKIFDSIKDTTKMDTTTKEAKMAEKDSKLPSLTNRKRKGSSNITINNENYSEDELVITPAEKASFIDTLITGDRYKQSYSIFGNKINVVIRNRTTEETQALYSYMRHELSRSDKNISLLEGDMSYILLVAQVEELNGTKFDIMKGPLTFTVKDGIEDKPGWYQDLLYWKSRPEGLTSALIKQIQLFEYKYWTMVNEAANKNFWNSDTSIEK